MLDVLKIRSDFPILNCRVNGKPLVYLDNAATSQKPDLVLEAMDKYYRRHNANVHRGIHTLSIEATQDYEEARSKIANFVGAKDWAEIIFVRNATEAINLVAYSWGRRNISRGDEIVLTVAEHHSNFVVWQQLAIEMRAVLKIVPVDENGGIDQKILKDALTKKTKLVTFCHVSNVLGTINPAKKLVSIIKDRLPDCTVLVDGSQAIPNMFVDISKLGCDFYVFTGHKMLGPTGIGILWAKRELLESIPPFLFGGEMISKVSSTKTTWNEIPWKFEAGTPNIAGAIGLGVAVDYLDKIGMENVRNHEMEIADYALKRLAEIPRITIYGSKDPKKRAGVVSFNIDKIHAHDVASILDSEGIAIRSGHHCAQPLMEFLGVESVARASFYLYNTREEADKLVEMLYKVLKVFGIKAREQSRESKISARTKRSIISS